METLTAKKKKSGKMFTVIGIAVLALIALTAGVVFITQLQKKKKEEKTTTGGTTTTGETVTGSGTKTDGGTATGGAGGTSGAGENLPLDKIYPAFSFDSYVQHFLMFDSEGLVSAKGTTPVKFILIPGGSTGVNKIADMQGRYMTEDGSTNGKTTMVTSTNPPTWSIENNSDGTVSLKSNSGRYMSAQPDGTIQTNREVPADWEKFKMASMN